MRSGAGLATVASAEGPQPAVCETYSIWWELKALSEAAGAALWMCLPPRDDRGVAPRRPLGAPRPETHALKKPDIAVPVIYQPP